MKITYVVTRSEPIGGVQIHIRDLATTLHAQGHSCTVVTGSGGQFVNQLRAAGVETVILQHLGVPINPLRDLRALREIHATLKALRPQLVSAHSSKAGILTRLAGRTLGVPVILTAHGWNFTPGIAPVPAAFYRQLERLTGPLASRIITVSEFDRRLAIDAGIARPQRVITVHNGMRDIPPALRAFPERRPVRLVMVARFGPQKDHATLLRALAKLTHREWHLDLIGDGPLMEQTRALAVDLGLTSRIRFLGERSDVDEFLANAQASLLVTNWEGFPRSILEAMRAGLPVIATSVAGIAEAVVDGDTGFLVPRGDVEMLRDRIDRVLIDPEVRQRLGANGRRRFEREFTLSVFLRNTFAVYRDLVGEPLADAPYAPAPDLATEQAS